MGTETGLRSRVSRVTGDVGMQLIATGKIVRPWLGIRIETLGEDGALRDLFKGVEKGVIVRTIEPEELAKRAGAQSDQEADALLWCGTAFPFVNPRALWYQLRHTIRHKECFDKPGAHCGGKKWWKYV